MNTTLAFMLVIADIEEGQFAGPLDLTQMPRPDLHLSVLFMTLCVGIWILVKLTCSIARHLRGRK